MTLPLILLLIFAFLQWIRFFQIQEESMRMLNERVRTLSQYGYLTGESSEDIILTDWQTLEFPLGLVKGKKTFSRQASIRLFTGRRFGEGDNKVDGESSKEVYMTVDGEVYHTRAECTHLKLSIRQTSYEKMLNLRNQGGERYHPCQVCVKEEGRVGDLVYITREGNRYHESLSCSGLLRHIRCVTLEEAIEKGRRLCSKCRVAKEVGSGTMENDYCRGMVADFSFRRLAA